MKKIGIIGGMGPDATIAFYQEIVKKCQEWYNAKYDNDYPEMFICNLPIPDVVENMENTDKIIQMLSETARKLENIGMDFIVIPCNTAHLFFDCIQKSISIPILNIIEETAKKIKLLGYNKVGLLATETTINNRLYDRWVDKFGIKQIIPNSSEREQITKIILNILNGKKFDCDKRSLENIIENLASMGAECIILGCTDLPLLIKDECTGLKLLDTIKILAESALKYAMSNNDFNKVTK